MSKLPIVEGVMKYVGENNKLFCMPGHKSGKGFKTTEIGRELYNNFIEADITEVEGLDNLHHPDGIIKEAQEKLSDLYGSRKSYFLVNGSTSGNMAMIFSCFNEGEEVIVERNCHRSIFNGIIMRKLKPIYIKNKIDKKINTPLSIDEEYLLYLIKNNRNAKGIIITYPNYYGVCCNLKLIINEAHKQGLMVLIDSAHGAHFGISSGLPENAVRLGADYVVMSAHKTLPSLTQTAYLHIGNNVDVEKIDFYVSAFLSTSPSYMLMCSMDYARYFLEDKGKEAYEQLIYICNLYKKKINNISDFHIISKEDVMDVYDMDLTRYVLQTRVGINMYKLSEYLRDKKVQPEMCDGVNIIFIFSPFNTAEEFKILYEALLKCNLENFQGESILALEQKIPHMELRPWEVLLMASELKDYRETNGRICKEAIVPYPPGIPIIQQGETIDVDIIKAIDYYIKCGVSILGMDDKFKIKVTRD
ncbi:aminotransferase class I/II-fold pyridoxal phosphate-dependent enzyme [Clostridium akagii]|uniref:aminotransferase class I/II-fold pyridoxal phosphate-dependent enzyme n=1 Tax=Clostridium akagii TaxID=91623 RepID=UPI00047CC24F|nr:aminotransferase class V-fold PLP-dependent enzyme [Clostridium akagii]